ncbi:MAG: DNA polymerase/3'-5' exonuclease PolX [Candidatus Hydrogenedentota bacterium]
MTNKEVIGILDQIALLLDLSGESGFKSRAYTQAARQIERLEESVSILVEEDRLREIKGVGDALEQKITEFVTTGSLAYYENLKSQFPDSLFALFTIPGLGPKRIKQVYDELNIQSLDALEAACTDGSLGTLKGFGPKMMDKLVRGVAFAKEHQGENYYDKAYAEARRLVNILSEESTVVRIEIAGSLRRCKEVVKDVDIIASSTDPSAVMARFVEDEYVAEVVGHGETKSSVVLRSGIGADLRVVSDEQFPYALAHFTGSKEHNVVMRRRAKERGLKLNEYGLFDGEENWVCMDETEIYSKLELPYIQPELREDCGEFGLEATPELIELEHLRGVIHCHSIYSDGRNSVREMATTAQELGYKYLTMTDHSQSAGYAGGLQPYRVEQQQKEIDALNEELDGFRVIKGIESDIRADGSLDYDEDVLKTFEVIVVSVHSNLDMTEDEATTRVVKAVENPYTRILGHPTGRLLITRKGYDLNYEKLFDACVANNVAIEINANCKRLDLDWRYVRQARDKGVKLCLSPDAHSTGAIDFVRYGVGIARKGWLKPEDVLNTFGTDDFLAWCAR